MAKITAVHIIEACRTQFGLLAGTKQSDEGFEFLISRGCMVFRHESRPNIQVLIPLSNIAGFSEDRE